MLSQVTILMLSRGSPVDKGGLVSVDMTWFHAHLLQRGEGRDKERERIEHQSPPLALCRSREDLRAAGLFVLVCIPRFSQGVMQNPCRPVSTTQLEGQPGSWPQAALGCKGPEWRGGRYVWGQCAPKVFPWGPQLCFGVFILRFLKVKESRL